MADRGTHARIVLGLFDGDPSPLIDFLEGGGTLDADQQRYALLPYLRKWSRKPTARELGKVAQRRREEKVCHAVWDLQVEFVLQDGKAHGSLEKAKNAYLAANPDVGSDSLDAYLRQAGGGVSPEALKTMLQLDPVWGRENG